MQGKLDRKLIGNGDVRKCGQRLERIRFEVRLHPYRVDFGHAGCAHSTLSWTVATGVEDTGDGIELSFVPGFVVAPNRAFKDSTDRARFLTQARAFAKGMKEAEV
jgi:hypothetical protein